jgi:hypothetical protein
MAENTCTGECIKCSFQQQTYCAAQHGHAVMNNQRAIIARLDRIEASLSGLAMQGTLINPLEEKAQGGSGAENREPEKTNPS